MAAAAALPQKDYKRVGRNGKPEREHTSMEPLKKSIPWDEWGVVFEWTAGALQIDAAVAVSAAAFFNIRLSKVAPAHVRTEGFKISGQGRLSTTAHFGASAAMLLHFIKEILEAARKPDKVIINVVANETWAELKILVPYDQYWHPNRLADLREQIEAENEGVVVPPFSVQWMRSVRIIEQHYQAGCLPKNALSVVFKFPGKVAAQNLQMEMWVVGNKFHALPFIPNRADILCSTCSQWWHSEFWCQQAVVVLAICADSHRTEDHRCQVATGRRIGKVPTHRDEASQLCWRTPSPGCQVQG